MKNRKKGLTPLREIISVCVRVKKNKRDFSLAMKQERHSQKIIVIDLIIMKLFGVCLVVFPFKEKNVFHVDICVFVCDCYFGSLIF